MREFAWDGTGIRFEKSMEMGMKMNSVLTGNFYTEMGRIGNQKKPFPQRRHLMHGSTALTCRHVTASQPASDRLTPYANGNKGSSWPRVIELIEVDSHKIARHISLQIARRAASLSARITSCSKESSYRPPPRQFCSPDSIPITSSKIFTKMRSVVFTRGR